MNTTRHAADIEIDVCPTCEGTWLDKGELEAVRTKVTHDFDPDKMEPPADFDFSFSKKMQESFSAADCPRCGKKMDTKEYGYWSQVMVDVCPAGCGLWLDKNEVKALSVFFQNNVAAEAKEESQKAMWSTLTSMFGG
jgi:Zn-finger nucleic acid-binding protein